MARLKKITAVTAAALMAFSFTACDEDEKQDQTSSSVSIKNSSGAAKGKVVLKEYEFPAFLSDVPMDELSKPVYTSFPAEDHYEEVIEQPFEEYKCEKLIDGVLYVYSDGGYCGLLDTEGNEVLKASLYTDIRLISNNVLELSYVGSDDTIAYMSFSSDGDLSVFTLPETDTSKYMISDAYSDDPEKVYKALYLPDGSAAVTADQDMFFDSIEWISTDDIKTDKSLYASVKAVRDDMTYIISLDPFGGYTVYERAYAKVNLKIGDVYGECYINSYDDYSELTKMLDSFGRASAVSTPSKDATLDFIQLTTGLNSDTCTQITVSPDGFCFTDTLTAVGDEPVNKYFSYLDKEDFVDLVLWVDQVLSQEYVTAE
ncbi:MAG: hypothetical protein IJ571_01300 [Ruminococcus sp.]|nr:hypothetical protein [Ruminococcus sp.]